MKKIILAVAMMAIIVASCSTKKSAQMTGADRDSHGCIGSAGYQWSEVRQDCIRVFDEGIPLTSATDKTSSLAAFIVFSADSSRVEAFIPNIEKNPILRTQGSEKYWSQNPKFIGAYNLWHRDGAWVLLKGNTPLYSSKP